MCLSRSVPAPADVRYYAHVLVTVKADEVVNSDMVPLISFHSSFAAAAMGHVRCLLVLPS